MLYLSPMAAFPHSSKTLIFVRGRRTERADHAVDDTVTEVLRPSLRKRFSRSKVRAHTPPKPRTTAEGNLPSIMVAQDSWAPAAPPAPPAPAASKPRPAARGVSDATVVGFRAPKPQKPQKPAPGLVSARRYNASLALVALGLGLLCLYLAPTLSHAMESAFATLNR